MAEVTKKDIQELLDSKIDPFARSVQQEFQKIDRRFEGVDQRFDKAFEVFVTKDEWRDLKNEVQSLRESIQALTGAVDQLTAIIRNLRMEYSAVLSQMDRHEKWIRQIAEKVGVKLEESD